MTIIYRRRWLRIQLYGNAGDDLLSGIRPATSAFMADHGLDRHDLDLSNVVDGGLDGGGWTISSRQWILARRPPGKRLSGETLQRWLGFDPWIDGSVISFDGL